MTKKIYLSPSNQPANKYVVGNTNEKVQMEAVAHKVKVILDQEYDCQCIMATLSKSINADGRPKEAKDKGCNIYLALHSNAGGGGKASGAIALYHPQNPSSKNLATNIVRELNSICPVKSNRASSVINGMAAFNGAGYGEVRTPSSFGLISVLAETDFHDNPSTSNWIINNKDAIARAYVYALAKTFNIAKKQPAVAPQEPAKEPVKQRLFRVQVGAYASNANAEAMKAKLKQAGFDGIIIES